MKKGISQLDQRPTASAQNRRLRNTILQLMLGFLVLFSLAIETRCDSLMKRQPVENPQALSSFFASLHSTQQQTPAAITRILHYGDSHVAADLLTGKLRRNFQRDFGAAGAGFIYAGKPWHWYAPTGVTLISSNGWQIGGVGADAVGTFGIAGISFKTTKANEYLRWKVEGDRFTLYLLQQPNGGEIEISLDNQVYDVGESLQAATSIPTFLEVETESPGQHTLELRTAKAGAVHVFGIVAENTQPGVIYDALGINGARASRPLGWDWQVMEANLSERQPNLIIVAYGSNEVGDADLNFAEYRHAFQNFLHRFRLAVPTASILVLAPPERAQFSHGKWRTMPAMDELIEAQRQAAESEGAAFWNQFQAMGGAGSINRWSSQNEALAQKDHVHLTKAGYELVADALYAELMRAYSQQRREP